MCMNINILRHIGLTDNEISIYITLLKKGPLSATDISHKTKLHRRNVYDALDRLIDKGVVSTFRENKRKYFSALEPHIFREIINERMHVLKQIDSEIKTNLIPEIMQLKRLSETETEVELFRGSEGLKKVFMSLLDYGNDYDIIGATDKMSDILRFNLPNFHKMRIKKNIQNRLLFNADSKKRGRELAKMKLTQVRYLKSEFSPPMQIRMFGDIAELLLISQDEPLAIRIHNQKIADSFREYFNILWKNADAK